MVTIICLIAIIIYPLFLSYMNIKRVAKNTTPTLNSRIIQLEHEAQPELIAIGAIVHGEECRTCYPKRMVIENYPFKPPPPKGPGAASNRKCCEKHRRDMITNEVGTYCIVCEWKGFSSRRIGKSCQCECKEGWPYYQDYHGGGYVSDRPVRTLNPPSGPALVSKLIIDAYNVKALEANLISKREFIVKCLDREFKNENMF
jgi:hypothetical protein